MGFEERPPGAGPAAPAVGNVPRTTKRADGGD
jgi:hypothetical protein